MGVAAVLLFIEQLIEGAVRLGADVAPLVPSLIDTFNRFGKANGATQADFDRFHALIKPFEDDLAAKAAAAQAEVGSSTS